MMSYFGATDSLVNACMYIVAKHISIYGDQVNSVPPNIKTRLLYLLCKRGLIDDVNISSFLYPKLREIDLSECDVTDIALLGVSQVCNRLVKIDLNAVKGVRDTITSTGVISLSQGCTALETVYLRRCCKVTDEAILAIASNCPRLRQLNLGSCSNITDASLEGLAEKSASLESLNVSSTSVTDAGIKSLCGGRARTSLKELHINHCLLLTDQSVEGVVSSCPSINILLFHGCPNMTDKLRNTLDADHVKLKQVTWTVY